jgi:hypothetical protein
VPALRTKIGRLIDHHEDLHTLSNVSLAALLGFVGVLANKDTTVEGLAAVLLLVPACTPCQLFHFALTAADLRRGILQLAHYIDKLATNANHAFRTLGPNDPTDGIAVWDRERWKAKGLFDLDRATRDLDLRRA